MGITDHVQKAGVPITSHAGDMIDESSPDTTLPEVRLDEQGIQLRSAVHARDDSRKARNNAALLGHEDVARFDLLDRYRDRIGVREKRVAISWIV